MNYNLKRRYFTNITSSFTGNRALQVFHYFNRQPELTFTTELYSCHVQHKHHP